MIAMLRILAAMVVLASAGLAIHRFAWVPLRCTSAASAGRIALEDAAFLRNDVQRRLVRRVRADLRGCDCVTPPDFAIPLVLGDAARISGEPVLAVAEYRRSLRIDHRPATYLRLGLAQLEAFDRRGAIESLARACAYDPAQLARIPYDGVREEVRREVVRRHGERWIR